MKAKLLILVLSYALIFSGCTFNSPQTEKQQAQQATSQSTSPMLKRVFVVIDGSNSLNEAACIKISNEVKRVFDALSEYQELRVFSTVEGTKTQPIFIWKKASPTKPSLEKVYINETIPAQGQILMKQVSAACSKASNGSYILHAIQSVYSNFQGAEKADESMLLILSDMLECSPKYYGCSEQPNGFEKMIKGLDATSLSNDCPLSKAIPLENIFACFISMNDKMRYVQLSSSPACGAFWEAAFIKMGYSKGPLNGTDIGGFLSKMRD
ncbi:MAG: hypothetical protein KIPDCIKN_02818 [Haliscomenobacter sp.]|nr:hypothetical protein [Haliscomenobacter sp.]